MDRRSTLVAITLGSALLVAGCAEPEWTRSEYDPLWADQDELACHRQAEREMSAQSAGFYGSLTDLYGQNFQQLGGRGMPQQWIGAPGPMFDIDPVRRILAEERLTDECMQAKGYVRKS